MEEYKGYHIRPEPGRKGRKDWTCSLWIAKQRPLVTTERRFEATGKSCATREEAEAVCIDFGKRIIDGGFGRFSIQGM